MRLWLAALLLLAGCASNLPTVRSREVGRHNAALNFADISFTQLDSGEPITLASYFKDSGNDWLLLFFGSKGCTSCGEKMKGIRDWALQQPIFGSRKIELIAAYADSSAQMAQVKRYRDQNRYTHLKWLDPEGPMLQKWFLPTGQDRFGVPVVVLINRKTSAVEWGFASTTHYTVEEVIARTEKTLGEAPQPTPTPTPTPAPTPTVVPDVAKNFTFYGQHGSFELKNLWGQKKLTIVSAFGELCTGCWDELKAWSAPGSLADLCSNQSCQVLVMENGIPEEEPTAARWTRMQALLTARKVDRFTLALDPHPSEGDAWQDRYFDGYLSTKYPEWDGLFGVVIYDANGIIVGDVKGGGDPEDVVRLVRALAR